MTNASASAGSNSKAGGASPASSPPQDGKDGDPGSLASAVGPYVRLLIRDSGAKRLIDYERYRFPEDSRPAGPFDLLLSVDMLQSVPESALDGVLAHIRSFSDKAFFVISTIFADKILDNGENAHCTIRDAGWWRERLLRHYSVVEEVPTSQEYACSFVTWVPKPETLRKLRQTKSSIKLRDKIKRVCGAPVDLVRYALNGFIAEERLMAALEGRTVALVGNSTALQEGDRGSEIDGHDIVVRLNKAPIISHRSHGARTDWIATGVPISSSLVKTRKVSFVLWMTKLRRMPRWMFKPRFVHLYARSRHEELERRIGKRASTGFMMIDLLARSKCRSVALYGFDFFERLSVSGYRTEAQVPHDFARERQLVGELLASDARFSRRG